MKADLMTALNAASEILLEGYEVVDWEVRHADGEHCLTFFTADEDADGIYIKLDANDKLEVEINDHGDCFLKDCDDQEVIFNFRVTRPLTMADMAPLTRLNVMTRNPGVNVMTRNPGAYILHNTVDGTRWRGTKEGHWVAEPEADKSQYNSVDGIASEAPAHVSNLFKVR